VLVRLVAVLRTAAAATTAVEAAAVATGLAYLVLAIRRDARCWIAAFVSTALYLYVFARAGLYMQAALQVYYLLMAVYGWRQWRGGSDRPAAVVTRWGIAPHVYGLCAVAAASAISWLVLDRRGVIPLLDTLTTWASLYACFLVARQVLENWAWWLVIDLLIAALCWRAQLYASALLYALYTILVVVGWRVWWRDWRALATARAGA
jgi:nicotinamide mononucleotide transporter